MNNHELEERKKEVRRMPIGADQKEHLRAELRLADMEEQTLCKIFEASSIDEFLIGDYLYALENLKKMRKKRKCKSKGKSKASRLMQSHAKSE